VLDNLLDNAIRYAPPGSEVTVTINREADQVACRVADAGPGSPPSTYLLSLSGSTGLTGARRVSGGGGLGLSIVRGLVQAHGGRTDATSIEGQGTTLTFWLPAAQTDP